MATAVRYRRFAGARTDWPAPTRIAARYELTVTGNLRRTWDDAIRTINQHQLVAGINHNDPDLILKSFGLTALHAAQVAATKGPLLQGFTNGSALAAQELHGLAGRPAAAASVGAIVQRAPVGVDLAAINPLAVQWALDHAAENVVASETVREIIRALVVASQALPLTPAELKRRIANLAAHGILGLDPRRASAVRNFEARLRAEGVLIDQIERRVSLYAAAQRAQRAMTIARTETIGSLNRGQQALWDQAVSRGALDRHVMGKVWLVTLDDTTCDECEALADVVVPLDEDFPDADATPPLHPNCRCAIGLARLEEAA